jgi:ornithine carbamoyltransferase
MKKDLLKLLDLSKDEIVEILDTADRLKAERKAGKKHDFPPARRSP